MGCWNGTCGDARSILHLGKEMSQLKRAMMWLRKSFDPQHVGHGSQSDLSRHHDAFAAVYQSELADIKN